MLHGVNVHFFQHIAAAFNKPVQYCPQGLGCDTAVDLCPFFYNNWVGAWRGNLSDNMTQLWHNHHRPWYFSISDSLWEIISWDVVADSWSLVTAGSNHVCVQMSPSHLHPALVKFPRAKNVFFKWQDDSWYIKAQNRCCCRASCTISPLKVGVRRPTGVCSTIRFDRTAVCFMLWPSVTVDLTICLPVVSDNRMAKFRRVNNLRTCVNNQ